MKTTKWMGTLAFTATSALVAVWCVSRWTPAHHFNAAKIVVAAVDIDLGQRLEPRFVKLIDWPGGKLPTGAFSDPHKLEGRVMSASMSRGEPFTERELQPLATTAAHLLLADLVVLAAGHGDAWRLNPGRITHATNPTGTGYDPDTAAWLSLVGEPWAFSAAKPAGG